MKAKTTLRVKIIGGFGVAIVAALAIGVYARHLLVTYSDASEASARQTAIDMERIAGIESTYLTAAQYGTIVYNASSRPEAAAQARPKWIATLTEATNDLVAYEAVPTSARARDLYSKIIENLSFNNKLANSLMQTNFPVPNPQVSVPTVQEIISGGGIVVDQRQTELREQLTALREQLGIDATAERDAVKADADTGLRNLTIFLIGVGVSLGAFAVWLSSLLVRRIRSTVDVLERVADGDLTASVETDERDADSRDETTRMAVAVNRMVERMAEALHAITEASAVVAGRSRDLSEVSAHLSAGAEEVSAQALMVSSSAEQVSSSINVVASGAEQLDASITEISRNVSQSANVASDAVVLAGTATETVEKLSESSTHIDDVVRTITAIADQTNLLALNATIEAARAGEAGRGFAVVAGEVKDLAAETAKATSEISSKISSIQSDAGAVTEAIGQISSVIDEVNSHQVTIASAVEQQSMTAADMARSVTEAASGSAGIAGNIGGVATASEETTRAVADIHHAADDLSRQADHLNALVAQFQLASD